MSYWEWMSDWVTPLLANSWEYVSALLALATVVGLVFALAAIIESPFRWWVKLPAGLLAFGLAFLLITWLFWSGVVNA